MSGPGWDFSKYVDPTPGGPSAPPPTGSGPGPAGQPSSGPFAPAPPRPPDYTFPGDTGGYAAAAPLEVGKPPVFWLVGCVVAAAVGAVLAGLWGTVPLWSIVAWAVCGPVAIGLLSAFSAFDTRQQARQVYSKPTWVKPAYVAALVLCAVAVVLCSLRIAEWVSRL